SISIACWKPSACNRNFSSSRPIRTAPRKAPSSRRSSTAAAAPLRPCWSSAAPCGRATSWSPAPNGGASGRSSATPERTWMPLVIKGDVQGSVEAVVGALDKLGTEEVAARVIHAGVGAINESDVTLAEAAGTAIIGFNVRAHKEARESAERAGVEIRYYNIIYDLVDDVKKAMSGLLRSEER